MLNKRAEILDDLARRGIKVKTGKELQDFLSGRGDLNREQLIVLLHQRQQEADAETKRREELLKKKRDGMLLRDFKPLELSMVELGMTPRSASKTALDVGAMFNLQDSTSFRPSTSVSSPQLQTTKSFLQQLPPKRLFANHKALPSVLPPITTLVRPSTADSPRNIAALGNRSPATPPP